MAGFDGAAVNGIRHRFGLDIVQGYRRTAFAKDAPVAQLDRAPDYDWGGREFNSLGAPHFGKKLATQNPAVFALEAATSVLSSTPFEPMMRTSFVSTSTRCASARRWSRR